MKNLIVAIALVIGVCGACQAIEVPRDPFLPIYITKSGGGGAVSQSAVVAPDAIAVSLKGIVWDPKTPIAILEVAGSSKSLGVGESSGQISVTKIDRQQVLLNRHGKISILKLGSNINL